MFLKWIVITALRQKKIEKIIKKSLMFECVNKSTTDKV